MHAVQCKVALRRLNTKKTTTKHNLKKERKKKAGGGPFPVSPDTSSFSTCQPAFCVISHFQNIPLPVFLNAHNMLFFFFFFCRTCLQAPQCQCALTLLHNLWKKALGLVGGGGDSAAYAARWGGGPSLSQSVSFTPLSAPAVTADTATDLTHLWPAVNKTQGGGREGPCVRIYWPFMSLQNANRQDFFFF